MSYLIGPRLHFAGRFRADVSTVNNYATHFKNPDDPDDPGWNPTGSGSWAVSDCVVTSAVYGDGTLARTAAEDPVIGVSLAQRGGARLVDLDPEQQMVSQIWGLRLQLVKSGSGTAFGGAFKTAAFSDLWTGRFPTSGRISDRNMSAFYQSVLTGVAWDNLLGSRFLAELKQASAPGLLSIKFNVDGFNQPQHVGRIVGTIGPAQAGEPAHFVVGRQCMGGNGPVWYFPALVDAQRGKLIADFGNALPTPALGGPIDPSLDLQIGLLPAGGQFASLGRVPIGPGGWYEQTAGICEFPPDRALSAAELDALGTTPLAVVQGTGSAASVVAAEGADGLYVRADDFVHRLSPGERVDVALRASRFGQPLANADIALQLDPRGLQQGGGDPDVGAPPDGLSFPATVTTNAQGIASVPLQGGSIAIPRRYIDGQVYGVRYALPQSDPNAGGYFNFSDFVSVLVWTDYQIPAEPTWLRDVQPVLNQYAQLYPVMKGFVKLGDYDSVVANKARIETVFSVPEEDPRYMPVTRDLSPAKRRLMVAWLATTGNAGKPNLGTPAPTLEVAAVVAAATPEGVAEYGGKAAALRRRKDRTA